MSRSPSQYSEKRRLLLRSMAVGSSLAVAGGLREVFAQGVAPGVITRDAIRPQVPYGVMSGDVTRDRAIVWSKTDRPSRLVVEYAFDEAMTKPRRIVGPAAMESTDYTARADLIGLPAGRQVFYRVMFQDLSNPGVYSEPLVGRLSIPPARKHTITFAFSGDEAGQGWASTRSGVATASTKRCAGLIRTSSFIVAIKSMLTVQSKPKRSSKTGRYGRTSSLRRSQKLPKLWMNTAELRLQPARCKQASLRGRSPLPRAMGRSRNAQQLYPGQQIGEAESAIRCAAHRCWRHAQSRLCSNTTRSASILLIRRESIVRSTMGRCSMCLCSTSAAIAVRTRRIGRRC